MGGMALHIQSEKISGAVRHGSPVQKPFVALRSINPAISTPDHEI
jgi:hypothetical protein